MLSEQDQFTADLGDTLHRDVVPYMLAAGGSPRFLDYACATAAAATVAHLYFKRHGATLESARDHIIGTLEFSLEIDRLGGFEALSGSLIARIYAESEDLSRLFLNKMIAE